MFISECICVGDYAMGNALVQFLWGIIVGYLFARTMSCVRGSLAVLV